MPRLVDHTSLTSAVAGSGSACEVLYPMHVISAREFLKLPKLLPHGELLQRGVLKKWSSKSKNKVILVSHQWLKYSEPDPDNEHLAVLQGMLTKLLRGEVGKVDDWWLHKAVWQTRATEVGKTEWQDVDIWIDYSCMPQVGPGADRKTILNAAKAVESIPAYVERCDLMLVIAPVCRHKDSGELCNYASWRGRGWCRMELMCSILARRNIRTMVSIGGSAKPFLLHPCEGCRLVTGTGQFSCCKIGHKFNGVTMQCDKEKVRSVLDLMLANKVEHARSLGSTNEQLFYASLRHAFLQDLPENPSPELETIANQRVRAVMAEEQRALERAGTALERARARLRWEASADANAKVTGFTLLFSAALMDDADAVRLLTDPSCSHAGELNVGLKKNFPHLSYMMKGATPLVGAMVFGRWETCEALIDAGADPKKTTFNGMDALFSACCKGNLPNITAWLRRFPTWDIDRVEPGMGLSATCLCAVVGSAEVKDVLRTLLDANASIGLRKYWGGEQTLLCLLSSNENVNEDAADFLIQKGCDINSRWRPQKPAMVAMLTAARLAGKLPHGTAVNEFAMLADATPLHFAAKRGDVGLARRLVEAHADPSIRNKQGRTPLDVAKTFFGGSVPKLLEASLTPGSEHRPTVQPGDLPKLLSGGVEHSTAKAAKSAAVKEEDAAEDDLSGVQDPTDDALMPYLALV